MKYLTLILALCLALLTSCSTPRPQYGGQMEPKSLFGRRITEDNRRPNINPYTAKKRIPCKWKN